MVLFEQVTYKYSDISVLKDCNYWYYLNQILSHRYGTTVLKDCNYWYYLNVLLNPALYTRVLKDCNYWYYLNGENDTVFQLWFLRIVIIGII